MFELIDRDAGGRIGKFNVNGKTITTPNIAIVINPNKMVVTPKELKEEFGCEIIITNSYIINRSEDIRNKAVEQGLHKFFEFDGPIYTDSGVFQQYSKGISVDSIDQDEILDFQEQIGSDIITPVDLFTLPTDTKDEVKEKIDETTKRIKDARERTTDRFLIGPVQGGIYPDMREYAAKSLYDSRVDVFAIGGIVPIMEQYRYKELCDAILSAKKNLPSNIPVHAFGAGHPMVFSLLAAIGCDLFDSAMYALAAERDAYLTNRGTFPLDKLREFPCSCKVCVSTNPESVRSLDHDKRKEFLIRHNLYATFAEIRTVRQAIRDGDLWELVQERVRAHPALLEAFTFIIEKYNEYFETVDPISKRNALFYSGPETIKRPEITRSLKMSRNVTSREVIDIDGMGQIPLGLKNTYPFSQNVGFKMNSSKNPDYDDIVKSVLDFQYGKGTSDLLGEFKVEVSRSTGRIRRVVRDGQILGTIRAHDGLFVPTSLAVKLISGKMKKVSVVDEGALGFVRKGRNVFAKFVHESDIDIVPGEEVVITDGEKPIAYGTAILNGKEMKEFDVGMAVDVRSKIE